MDYEIAPAILAEVCQDVLGRIGRVKDVSKETGTISGKVSMGWLTDAAQINLRIMRKDDTTTELRIQTYRKEAALTSAGAQNAMTKFLSEMGRDPRLSTASKGGW